MKRLILFCMGLAMTAMLMAQSPAAFNYQAVVRDAAGAIKANQSVNFRISILKGSYDGTSVLQETHPATTNEFGLVTLEIGNGNSVSGNFATINWASSTHYLKVELDPSGGNSFIHVGTSQLLSVPYALHAKTVEIDQVNDADADPANEIQELQISENQLSLTKGGGTVTLPNSGGGDNWGSQFVNTDATLAGNGTTSFPLKVADNGSNSFKIQDGSIVTADLANSAVTSEILAPGAVTTNKIGDQVITTEKLANSAVTGAKIAQSGASSGQVLSWNGTSWVPATVSGGGDNWGSQTVVSNSSYFSGNGTTGSPLSLSSMGASEGQVLKYNGTAWDNANDETGPFGESTVAIYNSTSKKFGFGINNPSRKVTIAESGAECYLSLCNGQTGYSGTDGILIGMQGLDGWVSTYENGRLLLGTNSAARAVIGASGNFGIGTVTPDYKLDVAGPANLIKNASGIALRVNGDEAIWYNGTYFSWGYGGNYNFFGDKVFIGPTATDPGSNQLVVNGAAAKPGGGSWATWSDKRLKTIHGDYLKGLDEITQLQPVTYSYTTGNKANLPDDQEYVGLVAQDVRETFPEAVTIGTDGYLLLDSNPVNIALINAVKELKSENDHLRSELENITARLATLERKISADTGIK